MIEPADDDDRASSSADKMIGRVVAGNFRIEALLGSGAMGNVYQAEQLSLGKAVAVKVLHPHLQSEEKLTIRFQREAKSASRLNHPNSIQIIDSGRDADGTLYIAMELLKGLDLAQIIREQFPLSLPRVIRIMTQVLSALEEAHLQGVIHRDLKPSNIMLVEWRGEHDFVKVCDFGIAKAQHDASDAMLTIQGLVCGTPEYMSPEQARAESLDGRADLYSAAVILYQLVTGDIPFRAPTPMGIVSRHLSDTPIAPSERRPDLSIPHEMDDLILRGMAKTRDHRPPTAAAFRADLLAISEGKPARAGYAKTLVGVPAKLTHGVQGTTVRMDGPSVVDAPRGFTPWIYRGASVVALGAIAAIAAERIHSGTARAPSAEVPRFSGSATPKTEPTGEARAAGALPLPTPTLPMQAPPSGGVVEMAVANAAPVPRPEGVPPATPPLPSVVAASPSHAGVKGDAARLKRPKGEASPHGKVPSATTTVASPSEAAAIATTLPAAAPVIAAPEAPRGPRDIVQEGERLLGQGSVNQACLRGEEARKLFPKFAPTYKFLGKCYMREGRPADAKDAYRKYLELSPSAPDAAFIEEIIKQK